MAEAIKARCCLSISGSGSGRREIVCPAYTARAGYWGLSSLEVLSCWELDHSVWLDVGCNLVFAYGCWRAHRAIFLLLPDDRRGRVRRWLAWTLVPNAPRPVRRLLSRLGQALR